VVENLESEDLILTIRSLAARRGMATQIYSDRGGSLVRARKIFIGKHNQRGNKKMENRGISKVALQTNSSL
jgi:hypothetical protein